MKGTARAAVITEFGAEMELREVPLPEPEHDAIIVSTDVATVCGSDVHIWTGQLAAATSLPVIGGHEAVGKIVEFGGGARVDSVGQELTEGDRVIWTHEPCGHCPMCTVAHEPTLCTDKRVGMLRDCTQPPYIGGTFAEYSYVWPRAGRVRVPDGLSSELASAASCAFRTVMQAFKRAGKIDFDDTVVIQGSGPLGLFATALASTRGARRIVVIGDPQERLAIARAWGADEVISVAEHPTPEARLAAVREATDGEMPNVVFEMSGAPGAFAEGVAMAAPQARYVVVGTVGGDPQPVLAHLITARNLSVLGSIGADTDSYHRALEFMVANRERFDWDRMIGERYALGETTTALRRMREGAEIKPVIDPAL